MGGARSKVPRVPHLPLTTNMVGSQRMADILKMNEDVEAAAGSQITYSEIGDELLADVAEQFNPAVGETKHDEETIEGDLVLTEAAAELISNYFLGWKDEGRNLINTAELDGAGATEMYDRGMSALEEDHAGKKISIMIL